MFFNSLNFIKQPVDFILLANAFLLFFSQFKIINTNGQGKFFIMLIIICYIYIYEKKNVTRRLEFKFH